MHDGRQFEVLKAGDLAAALADAQNMLTPADDRTVEGWLAELSVETARRPGDEFENALRLTVYTSRLKAFPADVVHHVLRRKTWQFWPTWAELEAECKYWTRDRLDLVRALRRGPRKPEEPTRAPTADERERMSALLREKFPAVSEAWHAAAMANIEKGVMKMEDGE